MTRRTAGAAGDNRTPTHERVPNMDTPSAHDVAAHILATTGPISANDLQVLVYYCQAWHLVWADEQLFEEHIEAWPVGPVVAELFAMHHGQWTVDSWPSGDPSRLGPTQRETVDAVVRDYRHLDPGMAVRLAGAEDPWRDARVGLEPTERSTTEITLAALAEYYGAVDAARGAVSVREIDWHEADHGIYPADDLGPPALRAGYRHPKERGPGYSRNIRSGSPAQVDDACPTARGRSETCLDI